MIAIINQKKKNKKGQTLYHLKSNHKFICKFWHRREEGLDICLLKASEEAKRVYDKEVLESLNKLIDMFPTPSKS